jgi:outer membrane receptor protein involved in Fe transport
MIAGVPAAGAAEAAKRVFDLPRGDAAHTLKNFADAGVPIVYLVDQVRGATTNAVRGEFTPREALQRMLAGSGLEATQDAATGAFVVSRQRRAEPTGREVGSDSAPQPKPKSNTMKTPRSLLAAVFGWLAASTPMSAQSQPTPPDKDPTVVLSPFTVNTDRDTGFVAASSLAGGRLATDLADTPVAYSVLTRDFIDALGITNAFDAADWSPNAVKSIASNGGGYGDDVSNSPGSYNVRGSGGGRGMRNFFNYFSPNDSYVVERFDFGRGPNAVLFGNGSLGGVATTTTKQARFDSNFTEIGQTFGSWNNSRTTLDVNRSVGERVAVRAAAVYQDSDGWRDKQFDKIRAAFLTTSFKVARNTTLRLEGEYGESKRNQTFSNLTDQLSGWDGKTTFSGRLDTLPSNANALGVTRRAAGYLVFNPFSGVNAVMNYQNDPTTLVGGANNQAPLAGFVQGSLPSFGSSGSNILYSYNLPGDRFANAIAGSAFHLPSKAFSLASDTPVIAERFKDLQLTVDHRIGGLFLQAAADVNRANQRINNIDVRGSNTMYIDINRVLPDGSANTHFLQPYADGNLRRNLNTRNAWGARFAAGYVKDASRWGNYTFNVMGGISENSFTNDAENLSVTQNADHRRWGSSGTALGAVDLIRVRHYWNETSRAYYEPTSIRFIDRVNNVDKTINPRWVLENDRNDSQQSTVARYKYAIAALNAKLFSNRLVFLGAVRGDNFFNYTRQQSHVGDYDPANWDGKAINWKAEGPADWATLTYVPKDASGKAVGPATSADNRPRDGSGNRLPQYANDRFKDDYNAPAIKKSEITRSVGAVFHLTKWLNPYANYAETFNPNSSTQRIDSSFLPPSVAKGIDVGVRASLLGGRLNISALRYVNKEENAKGSSAGIPDFNVIAAANALGDSSAAGRNTRGFASVPVIVNDIRDREADGYEMEVVANVSRQWRLSFNVGLPKVYEKNGFRDFIKFYDGNKATLRQIVLDTGGLVDANDQASVDTSIPVNDRSPDVNGAVNSYNNLRNQRKNVVAGRRIVQDQPAANFYSDYAFGSGKLKGLRLGGGVQYRGKQVIGYRASDTIVNPANPLTAIDDPTVDAYTPVYSPAAYYTTVATASYTFRFANHRELRLDLRINNLLNDQGPIFAGNTALRPKGGDLTSPARETVPNVYAYKTPISFNLTSTLKF